MYIKYIKFRYKYNDLSDFKSEIKQIYDQWKMCKYFTYEYLLEVSCV